MVSACVEKNARLFVRIGIFNKKKVGSRQFGGLWKKTGVFLKMLSRPYFSRLAMSRWHILQQAFCCNNNRM